jgi:hypothetical protein
MQTYSTSSPSISSHHCNYFKTRHFSNRISSMASRSGYRALLAATWLVMAAIIVEAWIPPITMYTGSACIRRIAFQPKVSRTEFVVARAKNDDNDKGKSGYKFGDLTRAVGRKVTGDENYQVGSFYFRCTFGKYERGSPHHCVSTHTPPLSVPCSLVIYPKN